MTRYDNTTAAQDRLIDDAQSFVRDLPDVKANAESNIGALVAIIGELDGRLTDAINLLDENDIQHTI